tara:strand:+ start:8 stop:268 length:261 start_codon:yes stop_codon:yes gene_type:complete
MGDSLYNNLYNTKYFVGVDMNKTYTLAFFLIGIVWGWGIIAIIGVTLEVRKDTLEYVGVPIRQTMPEIINTIQTIPVEVYKLERTE